MKLPFLSKKKEDVGFYLALLLTDEKASAVILHEELGKVKIIGQHQEFFSKSLDHVELEELINVVDKALSRAEESLPPSIETHQTIFGVKENWVEPETKKITKHHLSQLKKLCDTLDLTPIGFMVTSEAITHLLQDEEGAPLSAIIADIGKTGVTLTLLRGGKKIESIHGAFKEFSPPVTVDMLLRHFTVPVLPARIILSNAGGGEKLSQPFIAHQWSKSLPFLHVPQITVLPDGFDDKAVAFGAAAQMGFEMIGLPHTAPKPLMPELHQEPTAEREKEEEAPTEDSEILPTAAATTAVAEADEAESFGFIMNQDIVDVEPAPKAREKEVTSEHEEDLPHHAQIHHAVHDTDTDMPHHQPIVAHRGDDEDSYEDEDEDDEKPHGKERKSLLASLKLPALSGLKGLQLGGFGKNKKVILPLIIAGVFILGLVGLSLFYLYNVNATVELTMKPNMINQTTQAVFSTTASSDYDKNIIAAKSLTATVDGKATTDATGKKDVGEKAKGTVTVFNNSSDSVSLKSGTEIKSSNGLIFLLDKDATVSSSSGDIFSGTKPGTTNVSVTAKDIGPDQNLPSNTKFTIGSNATLAAKNDNAFSGGTKKSVTVVSKNDIAKLRDNLPKSLQSKAKDAIAQKASGDETLLPFFATDSFDKATYDKKVDDEAKSVTLNASVVFDGMAYQNSDLEDYAKSVLKRQASDTNFASNSIKASVSDAKSKDEKSMSATVIIEGGALPNVDTSDVAKEISGKSYSDAMQTLSGLPQIAKSEIKFSPSIPLLPQLFPTLPKNITVVMKSQ